MLTPKARVLLSDIFLRCCSSKEMKNRIKGIFVFFCVKKDIFILKIKNIYTKRKLINLLSRLI